jgi:hypothetical protein
MCGRTPSKEYRASGLNTWFDAIDYQLTRMSHIGLAGFPLSVGTEQHPVPDRRENLWAAFWVLTARTR